MLRGLPFGCWCGKVVIANRRGAKALSPGSGRSCNNAEGRMTYKLTITVTHHSNGELTVTQNLYAPLSSPNHKPPESEWFATRDKALARAKQLQAEAGGPDMAKIDVHDFQKRAP